jgi:RimJ/RimL family protein N-acetyltransferase
VRLIPVDRAARDAALAGDLGGLGAAPGWPHEDTAPGLGFLESGGLAFLVADDDDRVAGECGTKAAPNAAGMVEIGYGLAAPSRGRGLGTAAVAALIRTLAADPAVCVIEAEVHTGNPASWRLLVTLGFAPVGSELRGFQRYELRRLPGRS